MNPTSRIHCPMCGLDFDPAQNAACPSCPLQSGCQVVCCPNCGYETVDPSRSRLAQFAARILKRRVEIFGKENDLVEEK